jgi:hypothetical protein
MEFNMTKTEKLLNAFQSGARLTSKQIAARFGLKNPTAAIHQLRSEGHMIYFNSRKTMASYFNLGKPTREIVAAGFRALGSH